MLLSRLDAAVQLLAVANPRPRDGGWVSADRRSRTARPAPLARAGTQPIEPRSARNQPREHRARRHQRAGRDKFDHPGTSKSPVKLPFLPIADRRSRGGKPLIERQPKQSGFLGPAPDGAQLLIRRRLGGERNISSLGVVGK